MDAAELLWDDEEFVAMVTVMQDHQRRTEQGLALFGMYHDLCHYNKVKRVRGPESGEEWVLRCLGDPPECYNMFRVTPELFHQLHDVLVGQYGLKSSSRSSSIEALGMFLWILGSPESVRNAANRFGRSLDTVNRNFDKVLKCVLKLAGDNIKPLDAAFPTVHPRLGESRFSPYFNGCIGAIDGTHIPVVVDNDKVVQYMCRKGYTSQNVLAVCDFDMRFTFVLAGWPGSVHDMRVFKDATTTYGSKFPHPPPGKYYLVDSGYPNRPGYLAPYRGTKYHLPEFRNGQHPRGMKETFNFLHSSLRNVVERAFGVLKEKWRILKEISSFPLGKQTHIIVACMALHNFIRDSAMHDEDFAYFDGVDEAVVQEEEDIGGGENSAAADEGSTVDMNKFRDELAYALFHRS
ncbi:hypothetical protein ACP70R_026434 [Stipagrostis hirtigluma subsp. patula]